MADKGDILAMVVEYGTILLKQYNNSDKEYTYAIALDNATEAHRLKYEEILAEGKQLTVEKNQVFDKIKQALNVSSEEPCHWCLRVPPKKKR